MKIMDFGGFLMMGLRSLSKTQKTSFGFPLKSKRNARIGQKKVFVFSALSYQQKQGFTTTYDRRRFGVCNGPGFDETDLKF